MAEPAAAAPAVPAAPAGAARIAPLGRAAATAAAPSPSRATPVAAADDDAPLALYVHWPFCITKCPYCDFNSHVRPGWDEAEWARAYAAEIGWEAAHTPGRRLGSIFLGGGTPSLMAPATVAAVLDAAERAWGLEADCEITLEANPSSVEAARFAGFAAAGVNRVSLGLQALDDAALTFLGRPHGLAEGLAALDLAQRLFARVSFDLIYARPGQTPEAWGAELGRALAFGTGHLSLYQLTIEPGTRFATLARAGRLAVPDGDAAADLWALTQELTAAAGLPLYEISNHARPGEESRHNLSYWTWGDYAGVGPGAHGRRGGRATQRLRRPEAWLEAVRAHGHGLEQETPLSAAEAAREALLMGLRLAEGVDAARFAQRTGMALEAAIDGTALAELARLGLVEHTPARLRVSAAGLPLLDAILPRLVC
jgi:putative oxygen-independent coproporphyrinogen III oxidase